MYKIFLAKEPFKFSCSHFTILSASTAERLHGHNYQLRVEISCDEVDGNLGMAFDYNQVKPLIRAFCDGLDERILVPTRSPYLRITDGEPDGPGGHITDQITGQIEVRFNEKFYSFPREDVIMLEVSNVTCEELARVAGEHLLEQMRTLPMWTSLEVYVEETRGQGARLLLQKPCVNVAPRAPRST